MSRFSTSLLVMGSIMKIRAVHRTVTTRLLLRRFQEEAVGKQVLLQDMHHDRLLLVTQCRNCPLTISVIQCNTMVLTNRISRMGHPIPSEVTEKLNFTHTLTQM